MKIIITFIEVMLRFWLLMLALSIVCIEQTAADIRINMITTTTPGAAETSIAGISTAENNDLRILTDTSESTEEKISQETHTPPPPSLLSTTSRESLKVTSTSSSYSTAASSYAPATITNQAKQSITTKTLAANEEGENKLASTSIKPNVDVNKSVTEERVINLKQVTYTTESVRDAKEQQQITTDAALQQETDIHIQSRGNAEKAKNLKKNTSTLATKKQLTTTYATHATPPAPTNTSPFISTLEGLKAENEKHSSTTNAPFLTTSNLADDNTFPATEKLQQLHGIEQNHDRITQTETDIKGDDFKHQTTTSLAATEADPAINLNHPQNDSITLDSAASQQTKQATQALEDFRPIIRDVNEKLLRERTIFSQNPPINHDEWKQNLMPNELDYHEHKKLPTKTQTESYEHNINWSPYLHPAIPITDFTGKLLQEQDGVITEIERKFRLNEFAANTDNKPTKNPTIQQGVAAIAFTVNHKISKKNKIPFSAQTPGQFIERRVKKSFDFPMHRMASDALHMQQHFDFANTKFKSNTNDPSAQPASVIIQPGQTLDVTQQIRPQPEFSTTKFYNSKELYNEMLLHKSGIKQHDSVNLHDKELQELNNKPASLSLNSFAVLHSPKIAKLEEMHDSKEPQQQHLQQQKTLAIKTVTVKATKPKDIYSSSTSSSTISTTTTTSTSTSKPSTTTSTTTTTTTITDIPLATVLKTKKFQKELKRAKLLIKTMMPLQNSTTNNKQNFKSLQTEVASTAILDSLQSQMELSIASTTLKPNTLTTLKQSPTEITTNAQMPAISKSTTTASLPARKFSSPRPSAVYTSSSSSSSSSSSPLSSSATSTYPPKSSVKPIVRPRILSRLQEKINSLECELQNLPQDSHLWRGNETHELLLPIMTPENCKTDKDCTAMMVSWEGEAEIQSGDILIVEINDALLTPKDIDLTTSAHNTQVYQVTRSGHEHCDVTEGILLDITPLIVDGRKLVTLYDKDLTEGVNLLIVVSELWGSQCVRLKVTTKTENCGENADCSGKGICYSDYDMEEYECQCCSGFAGPHCEEIDACTPSPCTNNGICVDLSQGHEGNSYQCLCPYGYTGKNCQYELDPCNPAECMNGGSCVGNSTHFRCECTPGYAGPLCQHSLNECESSPCVHGICVDQEDGFRCFCQPGFAGELCNFEYNECESNPCQNAGECIDHIGSYECHCTKGYTGNRCQIKMDFCANKPCPGGRRCIDHGNDYSCECLGGRNGPDCNEMQRTQCNVNPCTHGGTCWSSGDSFYCACRPGFTGTMCEDEFVVETVVSSSEFMVDDTSARNFNDKSFGSSVVLKSPIELHNAYTAAIVLALVIFFVALYLTICHCKVNQTYRKFSTRTYGFLPILGFRLRTKQATSKISRHWLSGKGLAVGAGATTTTQHTATSVQRNSVGHLPTANASSSSASAQQHTNVGQLNERPFQRHLAMNLENDMYYTVDFSENSQHSPLIQ